MNSDVIPTSDSSRVSTNSRDHTTHRRAYLDTYAKSRGGGAIIQAPLPIAVALAQPVALPVKPQPTVVAVPVQQKQALVTDFMKPQPAVNNFNYQDHGVVHAEVVKQVEPVNSQRKYLDGLTRRHYRAVEQAPAAEETVMHSTLSSEAETLFEDPANQARLEANLKALYTPSLTEMISTDAKSASAAHVRTIIASAFACGIMAVGIFTFMGQYSSQPVVAQPIGSPVIEVESSGTTAPVSAPAVDTNVAGAGVVNPEQPVRIVVSSIGVNAPVEGLGTTPEGLIAVPKAYGTVGWYNKGSLPGKPGPAVLVGHYSGGNGAVFDKLGNLNNGDLITTTNTKGQSFTYRVTAKNEYEKDKVPMAQIFKSGSESRLEIITCAGKWQSKTYNNRLVVTAELVK